MWSGMSKAAQRKEKRHWAVEEPELDSKLRSNCFIDPDDMEFKDTMKNEGKKLESSMDSAMPCKVRSLGHGETCGENESNTRRSK